ncbi:sulfatase-like hydrolase/transferase [Natronorubrum daqingense]|uniref:Arylsulfatase A n=2 Tax=Natronorubrum daqingense TaxID=588898 RepID=A0A1N7E0C9_9EURY|nr:sulfatase-like hydrolase/transferase [Natronorubrum daqingense]SIR81523.1 Arylsulfatase A [Natronorubrum daqingense]
MSAFVNRPGMRNVVLLCLDSVRKDTFDDCAARVSERSDLTFEQCRAASSWSAPSYASMMTGKLPHEHGVHTHDTHVTGIDREETLLGDLESHRALGVSTNVFAGSAYGFDAFFDEFVDITEAYRYPDGLDPVAVRSDTERTGVGAYLEYLRRSLTHDHPGASLANGAVGFLDALSETAPIPKLFDDGASAVTRTSRSLIDDTEGPFFLFGSFMEAHTPLRHVRGFDRSLHPASNTFTTAEHTVWELMESADEHREFLETRRELYGASIEYLDRTIDAFLEWIHAETSRETTVVVTADHGENQGYDFEDGLVRHKSSLSEGLVHVPLLVSNPPEGYPETEDRYVSHLELRSLLAAMARDEVVDPTSDRVVAEHVGMSAGPEPPDRTEHWDRLMRAAYDGSTKYVWDSQGGREEYELDRDRPGWQRRVDDATLPEWATERFAVDAYEYKRRALAEAADSTTDGVDEGVQDRLEKLGYV